MPYFPPHRYKTVLTADKLCPAATSNAVCTTGTNNALQSVIDTLDSTRFPPDFSVPRVFRDMLNFISRYSNIINALSLEAVVRFLRPIYEFLTKRRCFSIDLWFTTLGPWCFSIKDIFNNWLVRFVSGLIDRFLSPLFIPIKKLFERLFKALPSLPSLSLPQLPNWAAPSFSIDFDVDILNFPCLDYDYTAQTVQSKCFDFPSLKIPTPFIFNPLSFVCDEGCDASCNTGCDTSCDTSCDSACNQGCDGGCDNGCDSSCDNGCDFFSSSCDYGCDSSCDYGCDYYCDTSCDSYCNGSCNAGCDTGCASACDSSCDFVATCGSSGRRLEDSSAITAEPKAIGWSERLAAAAAQEGK